MIKAIVGIVVWTARIVGDVAVVALFLAIMITVVYLSAILVGG